MRQNNAEELYAAIGYGGMTIANCLPKLKDCLLYTSRCV